MTNNFFYDIIVIGAGHAGCEAGLASARLGNKTLILATNLDTVAYLACNPSIGGTAKGQIVKEIDALGGQMALCADSSMLQMRMLNLGKGPAVYSPRAQVDKNAYHHNMKSVIEHQPNLSLRQGEATDIVAVDGGYQVTTAVGMQYSCKAAIVCCGVYLNSKTIVGTTVCDSGPNGFANAKHLTDSLLQLGITTRRFKTGTPARVKLQSIDTSVMSQQKGGVSRGFSYLTDEVVSTKSCYLTYSTDKTKEIILANKHLAPIFNGGIEGTGPRYCPSIEDKVVRFADKERHQLFLEPEDATSCEYYVQGASSSMPATVQLDMYRSIVGLENVEIMRDAYAIEYDCIDATTLDNTLMSKGNVGLFFAGQICGTSGYEEAGCQGLVAGINASRLINGQSPFVLTRTNSYIGVLIDDITTKNSSEPYRMMTSRAEHRLVLRQDNADLRLTQLGRDIGLVDDNRYAKFVAKKQLIDRAMAELTTVVPPAKLKDILTSTGYDIPKAGLTLADLLKRQGITCNTIKQYLPQYLNYPPDVLEEIEIETRYSGYIDRQQQLIAQAEKQESKTIPTDIDYSTIEGLRIEARQKLAAIRPVNIGQASRISGVSPADIMVLIVYLSTRKPDEHIG